ncbi:MAG TPA: hypothetical protein VKU35_01185 [Candidatus Limnocylindria bacterium]|nr:hypothetical protein [Candidatus Limnocylindria bacterium]
MVLAALISFGILLVAWIASPTEEVRLRVIRTPEPTATASREQVVEAA